MREITKVNKFNFKIFCGWLPTHLAPRLLQNYVLWLQIRMDNTQIIVQVVERCEYSLGSSLDEGHFHAASFPANTWWLLLQNLS